MPDGTVRWYDPHRGDAEVVRQGRAYAVPVGAIEPSARHPGARVHFDVERVDGAERAVRVRLRQSARASRRRRGFGTLAGARYADTKGAPPSAGPHPELHLAETHPLEVARAWATSVAGADTDGALVLYAPSAVVRAGDGSPGGRAAVTSWLAATPAFGCTHHARVRGDGDAVDVRWEAEDTGDRAVDVRLRIAHGRIAEQWAGAEAPATLPEATTPVPAAAEATTLVLHTEGDVAEADRALARATVLGVLDLVKEPVLFASVTLRHDPDPARTAPAHAEVHLDLDGDLLRAHAAARTFPEALDLVDHRLRDQLEHRARRRRHLHRSRGVAEPGEWRHGDVAPARPPFFDRPAEERQLVREKTFAVEPLTCDEAVFDMGQLDYDFYLFVDLETGLDSVVEQLDDGTYRMTRLELSDQALGPTASPVALSYAVVPLLGVREAIDRLGETGERHLFFADAATGRGRVLYRRYDGHYGLLTPE